MSFPETFRALRVGQDSLPIPIDLTAQWAERRSIESRRVRDNECFVVALQCQSVYSQ